MHSFKANNSFFHTTFLCYFNMQRKLKKPVHDFCKFQKTVFFKAGARKQLRDTNLGNYISPDELCQTKFPLHIRLLLKRYMLLFWNTKKISLTKDSVIVK